MGRYVTIELTRDEDRVLTELATEQDISEEGILRQSLRLYQMQLRRLKAGETVTWSGDAQRQREFLGLAI